MKKLFSEKLKEYRQELSLKRGTNVGQIQLANELNISKGNIGNLESGKRMPSKSLLVKLAKHSGKSLEYWMDGIEKYKAPDTVDLVLDKMIEEKVIISPDLSELSKEAKELLFQAIQLEIERKLK